MPLAAVTLSIVVHGISGTPLMNAYAHHRSELLHTHGDLDK
jgi:hypothetical protein